PPAERRHVDGSELVLKLSWAQRAGSRRGSSCAGCCSQPPWPTHRKTRRRTGKRCPLRIVSRGFSRPEVAPFSPRRKTHCNAAMTLARRGTAFRYPTQASTTQYAYLVRSPSTQRTTRSCTRLAT